LVPRPPKGNGPRPNGITAQGAAQKARGRPPAPKGRLKGDDLGPREPPRVRPPAPAPKAVLTAPCGAKRPASRQPRHKAPDRAPADPDPPPLQRCLSPAAHKPPPTHPFPLSPLCPKSIRNRGQAPSSNLRFKELRTAAKRLRPSPIAIARRAYVGPVSNGIKPLSRAPCDFVVARDPRGRDRGDRADRRAPGRLIRTRPGGRSRRHR
jgi:hypothetical protein